MHSDISYHNNNEQGVFIPHWSKMRICRLLINILKARFVIAYFQKFYNVFQALQHVDLQIFVKLLISDSQLSFHSMKPVFSNMNRSSSFNFSIFCPKDMNFFSIIPTQSRSWFLFFNTVGIKKIPQWICSSFRTAHKPLL